MESGTESENQLMVMPDREVGNYMYRRAVAYAREKNIYQSLQCYVDAFLLRSEESRCEDKNWLDFFRLEFIIYLLGKKQVCCSLCEGDMVHDWLKDEYQSLMDDLRQSEIPFKGDLRQWFASLELPFPWMC
ncbi:MAG: hypothetical protein WCR76_02485 [Sphaerochaetaceae bacterium]|jgi:hypothetical protein